MLSIPRIEALALPIKVEQTTLEPTPIDNPYHGKENSTDRYNHTLGIYRCYVQDFDNVEKLARISTRLKHSVR